MMMASFDATTSQNPQTVQKPSENDQDDAKLQSNIQRLQKLDQNAQINKNGAAPHNSQNTNYHNRSNLDNPNRPKIELDEEKLRKLCEQFNMYYTIESTQRTITQNGSNTVHEKGGEVFVGKLPRDVFEEDLLPLAHKYGELVEFRIMLDYSGYNRGYAFLTFKKRSEANAALKGLNNFEIRSGKLLGVCRSVDNCRLFVGGIPKSKKRPEIMEEMKKVSDGVVDVIVYPSAADKTKNRGFAFVEYESHKTAAMSRRKLMPGKIQLWGQPIAVDWAEPEIDVDDEIMAQVKILYVRNLMLNTREETLEEIMTNVTGVATIERVKKIRDYAFVHFNTRENAGIAKQAVNGMVIDGSTVEITWAKPVDREAYAKYNKNSNRNYDNHGSVHQNFDHLKGIQTGITAQMGQNFVYLQPNMSHDGQSLIQPHQGIPVIIGPNGRPMQAVNSPVILAPQINTYDPRNYDPRNLDSRNQDSRNHDQRIHGQNDNFKNDQFRGQVQNMQNNQFGNNRGYNYRQPYQQRNQVFQNFNQNMIRTKPRGAGGIRAVGSRQYLNNKDGGPVQNHGGNMHGGNIHSNMNHVQIHAQVQSQLQNSAQNQVQNHIQNHIQVGPNSRQNSQNQAYFQNPSLTAYTSQDTDSGMNSASYALPPSDRPDSTEHMSSTANNSITNNLANNSASTQPSVISPTNNQTIFSQPLYPASYLSTIPNAQLVTTSANSGPHQLGAGMQGVNQQMPLMYALINPDQQGAGQAIQQNGQNPGQNYGLNQQYMLIQGQQAAQVPATSSNVEASSNNFEE